MKKTMHLILMLVACVYFMGLTACSSSVVPPGNTVIVNKASGESDVKTQGSYFAWGRDRVYFVDTKLKGFTEQMEILCADNINMTVDIKWLGSFNVNEKNIKIIKDKVPAQAVDNGDMEGYQLSLDAFYKTAMRDIVRSNSRMIVRPYITDNIKDQVEKIQSDIRERVTARFQELGYPITTTDVLVSNLDYPDEVTNQRKAIKNAQLEDEKAKALAKAALAQATRDAEIAAERGKAKVVRAQADAAANAAYAKSLTPAILMDRQLDVMAQFAASQNKDMIIMPYNALGGDQLQNALLKKLGDTQQ